MGLYKLDVFRHLKAACRIAGYCGIRLLQIELAMAATTCSSAAIVPLMVEKSSSYGTAVVDAATVLALAL